jgi:hypothetical protein
MRSLGRRPRGARIRAVALRARAWLKRPSSRAALRRLKRRGLERTDHSELAGVLFEQGPVRVRLQLPWMFPIQPNIRQPLAPVEASPMWETAAAFRGRALEHWRARLRVAHSLGFSRADLKTAVEHFDWFVRYQVKGESWTSIATNRPFPALPNARAEASRVAAGVKKTAKLLGLALRSGRPGRPRKSTRPRD